MTDNELDRALSSALDVEPRADFLARVRMRVAAEPAPSNWLVPARLAGAAAVMVVAAAAGVVFWNGAKEPQGGTVTRVAASPEIVTVQPEAPVTAESEAPTRPSTSAAAAPERQHEHVMSPASDVQVASADTEMLALAIEAARQGVLVPAGERDPGAPLAVSGIDLPPLEVEPLAVVTLFDTGERQ